MILLVGCGTQDFKFKLQNINTIILQDVTTGGSVTIDDKDTISTLINNFNDLSVKKEENKFISPAGNGYKITFKDVDGNIIEDIHVFGENLIYYSNYFYTVTKGTIDLDLIRTHLEK